MVKSRLMPFKWNTTTVYYLPKKYHSVSVLFFLIFSVSFSILCSNLCPFTRRNNMCTPNQVPNFGRLVSSFGRAKRDSIPKAGMWNNYGGQVDLCGFLESLVYIQVSHTNMDYIFSLKSEQTGSASCVYRTGHYEYTWIHSRKRDNNIII